MRTAAEQLPNTQVPELDRELRVSTDTATWLAETLHGSMRTSFEFTFDGQTLRGEDGGSIDDVFDDAVEEARIMAEWNPSMLFELRRRLTEREELDEMYEMVQGNRPNTMIVLSDFPPELMDADEDVGGYNVSRQQTMMRVITLGGDGTLRITSQSLDGSDREALEAVYAAMGEPVEEGELLPQRIHRDLPPAWQDQLADNLTGTYDASLAGRRGGEWHAGISQRPDRNILNTYEFAVGQQDLIDWFTREKLADPAGAERHRYKLAATAKARHERYLRKLNADQAPEDITAGYDSVVPIRGIIMSARGLEYEMAFEGRQAASRGEVFSGCGFTAEGEEESEDGLTGSQLRSGSGYGSKFRLETEGDCEFISKECPKCGEKNVKTKSRKNPTTGKVHYEGACGCKS